MFFVAFGGMSWPLPYRGDEDETVGMARSRATAYEALIGKPATERELIVYAVRRAMREGERMRRASGGDTGGSGT